MATNKSPFFVPIHQPPHHFSDYGFDPQIDYFEVLEEARKHKREASRSSSSMETIHFKLPKPMTSSSSSRLDHREPPWKKIKKSKKKRWWRDALHFLRRKWAMPDNNNNKDIIFHNGPRHVRSISGPIYITESLSGPGPVRPSSGPLAGTLTPARKGEVEIPYVSLRELNAGHHHYQRMSTSSLPIYLVT